ncbi:hypothetical protein WJX72_011828 [[Myrmecia] bisecta]|uniref:Uncharacterized protein n=1 Tax=[Myrmecia] bisecta TaxID=41462 RepID=A0AAW1RAJ4_9CHLO
MSSKGHFSEDPCSSDDGQACLDSESSGLPCDSDSEIDSTEVARTCGLPQPEELEQLSRVALAELSRLTGRRDAEYDREYLQPDRLGRRWNVWQKVQGLQLYVRKPAQLVVLGYTARRVQPSKLELYIPFPEESEDNLYMPALAVCIRHLACKARMCTALRS